MTTRSPPLTDLVRAGSQLMGSGERDYEELLSMVGDRPFVLLGEASHVTQEFRAMRAGITHRLIAEQGFDAVAVEVDWPDALSLDRYARSPDDDGADAERCPPGRERWRT